MVLLCIIYLIVIKSRVNKELVVLIILYDVYKKM